MLQHLGDKTTVATSTKLSDRALSEAGMKGWCIVWVLVLTFVKYVRKGKKKDQIECEFSLNIQY